MDDSPYVVGFALAALSAGASGLRIESVRYVAAVRAATDAPISAWQMGIRHFDTAPYYGTGLSERRLGSGSAWNSG